MLPHPPPPAQFAPGVDPPEQRIGSRSASRNIVPVIGSVGVIAIAPVEQSRVPLASASRVLTTQTLVAAAACEIFGIGTGGPNRQPFLVHLRSAHLALLQLPALQVAPDEQSALVVHVEAQSLLVVHASPCFDRTPCVHRLPPASVGVVPVRVTVVPLQVAFRTPLAMSGIRTGNVMPTAAPPK